MDKKIIKILREDIHFKQKKIIIDFLEKENYFYSIINSNNKDIDSSELINLGKFLNSLKKEIIYNNEEFQNLNEYLSYLGIQAILSLKYIPKNYQMFILDYEFTGIGGKSIQEIYNIMYKKYLIIEEIYTQNGEFGLTKYIVIDKKLFNQYNMSLSDLMELDILSMDDIINYTSTDYAFNKYKSTELIDKTKDNQKIISKKNDTIYL